MSVAYLILEAAASIQAGNHKATDTPIQALFPIKFSVK